MEQKDKSIKRFKEQQQKCIDGMKARLLEWIQLQGKPVGNEIIVGEAEFFGPYTEINAALLETAIDRMLVLLGGPDTREFLLKAYDRRIAAYRASLT